MTFIVANANDLLALLLACVGITDGVIARYFVSNLMSRNPDVTLDSIRKARIVLYVTAAAMLVLAFYFYDVKPLAVKNT